MAWACLTDRRRGFAGLRTFTMLGAVSGLSGLLRAAGVTAPAAILFAGAVAIVAAGYLAASRVDTDGTTEVAALVVLAAGLLCGPGIRELASGITALVTLVLVEKTRLARARGACRRGGAAVGRAVRGDGPGRAAAASRRTARSAGRGSAARTVGARPVLSGISFAGYVARRLVGSGHGYLVTGLLGGIVSSTNVTFTFARMSRTEVAMDRALAFGAVAANAMLYPRVIVATAILNPSVVLPLVRLPRRPSGRGGAGGGVRPAAFTGRAGVEHITEQSAPARHGATNGRALSSRAHGGVRRA